MNKSYLRFLPYAGKPTIWKAEEHEKLMDRISRLRNELKSAERDLEIEEIQFFNYAKSEWTIEEITEAKNKAKKQDF